MNKDAGEKFPNKQKAALCHVRLVGYKMHPEKSSMLPVVQVLYQSEEDFMNVLNLFPKIKQLEFSAGYIRGEKENAIHRIKIESGEKDRVLGANGPELRPLWSMDKNMPVDVIQRFVRDFKNAWFWGLEMLDRRRRFRVAVVTEEGERNKDLVKQEIESGNFIAEFGVMGEKSDLKTGDIITFKVSTREPGYPPCNPFW